MYHIEYGNIYGVSYINTSDINYILKLKAYIDSLGGFNFRIYREAGKGYKRIDISELEEGATCD